MRGRIPLWLMGLCAVAPGWGDDHVGGVMTSGGGPCGGDHVVSRLYRDTSRHLHAGYAVTLRGTPGQIMVLTWWLDEIYRVPYGRETLAAITDSGNELTICHSDWALMSAGRTLAPVSRNLTNGRGEDALILFDARIPYAGSHEVYNGTREPIGYTAVQNLYHELAHARHLTAGTWRYFDSEGQAIADENEFRRQLAGPAGNRPPELRTGIAGRQFWWPAD